MNDTSQSDVCSNISDLSYLSDFEDECQSFNFDLSNMLILVPSLYAMIDLIWSMICL